MTVARGDKPAAEIRPLQVRTGRDLKTALVGNPAPDDEFAASIAEAADLLAEVADPWDDG